MCLILVKLRKKIVVYRLPRLCADECLFINLPLVLFVLLDIQLSAPQTHVSRDHELVLVHLKCTHKVCESDAVTLLYNLDTYCLSGIYMASLYITLFRFITVLCGIDTGLSIVS